MYKVLKKDGRIEDFDWKKVVSGVINSGSTQEEAEKVAEEVELWLSTAVDDGVVKSYDLHIKVLETLRGINPQAAIKFEEYKKPEPQ